MRTEEDGGFRPSLKRKRKQLHPISEPITLKTLSLIETKPPQSSCYNLQCLHVSHFIHIPQFHCPVKGAAEQLMCTPPKCQTLQQRSKYRYILTLYIVQIPSNIIHATCVQKWNQVESQVVYHSLILKTLGGTGNKTVVNSNVRLSCTKLYHSLVLPHKVKQNQVQVLRFDKRGWEIVPYRSSL